MKIIMAEKNWQIYLEAGRRLEEATVLQSAIMSDMKEKITISFISVRALQLNTE